MSKYLIPVLFSLIFCFLSFAFGGIIHVPQDQPSIQAGINTAANGDTVLVADSTYYENINFNGKAITVASYMIMDNDTTHRDSTIINGGQPTNPDIGSVISFVSGEDTTSIIYGFTITGGRGTPYVPFSGQVGGGIFCNNSGCKILASKIINNTASGPSAYGGGLGTVPWGDTAYVVLKDNQIMHNTITANADETWGGGVALMCNGIVVNNTISFNSVIHNATISQAFSGGLDCGSDPSDRRTVIVESNKITHNSVVSHSTYSPSAAAGGVSIFGCQGRFTKNEVGHNEVWVNSDRNAIGAGMEIYEVPASFIIEDNIIRENAVTQGTGYGGGINIASNAFPTLINNIIDGNSATNGSGGGILITENCTVKFINNTIINNQATTGGGMYLGNTPSTNYLMNTIIWGNQATTSPAIHIYAGTIDVAYSDVQGGWPGTGDISKEPMLRGDSLMLSDSSSCIGAGTLSYTFGSTIINCPSTCFLGNPRPSPAGTLPDMGACESALPSPVVSLANPLSEVTPKSYELKQNYSNPFNPTTTIEFALPQTGYVTLKIFNILGEEVATLVLEKLAAGSYKYRWDASGLASGIYLYRLESGGFTETKKMILLK